MKSLLKNSCKTVFIGTLFTVSTLLMVSTLTMSPNAHANSNSNSQIEQTHLKTQVFNINKMTCKMCHITVRRAMEKVNGVIKASVNYDKKTATVTFDPSKVNIKQIALASTNIGYPATAKLNQ